MPVQEFAAANPDLNDREVIIGAGLHAAVYAATRVALGYPKPAVLEKTDTPGGLFSLYATPFWMNSASGASLSSTQAGPTRLRPVSPTDDLNWLPNCAYQVECATEYPSSIDMARAVELNLEGYADVYTKAPTVVRSSRNVVVASTSSFAPRRVIDARGITTKYYSRQVAAMSSRIVTGLEFMNGALPSEVFDGPQRVAIIGGADSGSIVAEVLLRQAPRGGLILPAGSMIDATDIGWYGPRLPLSKEEWASDRHARYLGLARHFPQNGVPGIVHPFRERGRVAPAGPEAVIVNGRTYSLAVLCDGMEPLFGSSEPGPSVAPAATGLWRANPTRSYYVIGAAAQIPLSESEKSLGFARFTANSAAIFRLAPQTAVLAASFGA